MTDPRVEPLKKALVSVFGHFMGKIEQGTGYAVSIEDEAEIRAEDVLAALGVAWPVDSLDAAWKQVEDVLPDGWAFEVTSMWNGVGPHASAWPRDRGISWGHDVLGPTPQAALQALATRIKESRQ